MFKKMLLAAAVGCVSIPAMASSIGLSDNNGNPLAVTLSPGSNFDLTITLIADEPIVGVGYFLQSSASGVFDITGRTLDGSSPFTVQTTNTLPIAMDPTSLDLGVRKTSLATNSAAGTYTLGTVTLSVDPTAAGGTYTIKAINGEMTAAPLYEPITLADSADYIVTVAVPEPASLGIIGLAGLLISRRRA